ncbi:hypothetical protein C8Q75DRAFT_806023 [Abortiporus biennis]|nr:hypothetical protein C8Q75DRAFT_806023 [Abortiporus biennis]
MSLHALVFPPEYDDARPWLIGHALYGVAGGILSLLWGDIMIASMNPMLRLIEAITGLARFQTNHPESHELFAVGLAFSIAIGSIYLLCSGPFWNVGGKILVEGSIIGRLIFAIVSFTFCFSTPYGSSLLFLTATLDVISTLALKRKLRITWYDLLYGKSQILPVDLSGFDRSGRVEDTKPAQYLVGRS